MGLLSGVPPSEP